MSATIISRDHAHTVSGLIPGWISRFGRMLSRSRTYAALSELDDRLLRDIGLARGDLEMLRRH